MVVNIPTEKAPEPMSGAPLVSSESLAANVQAGALYGLDIIGPDPPVISNRAPAIFQCVARDTSGQKITISPRWSLEPHEAGVTSYSRDGETVTFLPHSDFIGRVEIFLTDSITGLTAQFNASDSLAECDRGLSVFHCLRGDAPGVSVSDRQGFQVNIPDGALSPGDTALIFLRKPPVLEIKRITSGYRVWGQIYDLRAYDHAGRISLSSGDEISLIRPLELALPLDSEACGPQAVVGRWSYQDLEWSPLGGVSSDDEITVPVDHFSQFAVLSVFEPLGWHDIRLLPNPFTPHDPYGLQLGFTLSSDQARKPFVTIRVYSITGRLVRTICENEPVPKGIYSPGESFHDSRGEDITRWDGRTDSGKLARNGRYLIHFRADDSDGTVSKLLPVVLIK